MLTAGVVVLALALTGALPARQGLPITLTLLLMVLLALGDRAILVRRYRHDLTQARHDLDRVLGDLAQAHQDLDRARRLAGTDDLTALGNRRVLMSDLHQDLTSGASVGLLLIDLDAFKTINDTHGHVVGDHVLQVITEHLSAALDPGCRITRLDGDEFAITTADDDPDHLNRLAQQVHTALAVPITFRGTQVTITASIGTTTRRSTDTTPTDLLTRADHHMYQTKNRTKNHTIRDESTTMTTPPDHANTAAQALLALEQETTHGHDYLWPSQIHTTHSAPRSGFSAPKPEPDAETGTRHGRRPGGTPERVVSCRKGFRPQTWAC
jgi:diguanylate cyclase (GGDEF)-like protein